MRALTAPFAAGSELARLLGTASLLAMAGAMPSHAQELVAAEADPPETVLVTGSLIRGTSAIGVPVTEFTPGDFVTTGALTTADLFRSFPAAYVQPGSAGTNPTAQIERGVKVNIRGLDTNSATRSLLMIDGMRFPGQGSGQCIIDPSIIPALSVDHIDVLVDGASATYGSDAIGGVINIILKRNMDGAVTQAQWTTAAHGRNRYAASALWGRTWDGGQITLSYEWYNETPVMGNFSPRYGMDHSLWGLDDRRPLASSAPATLSIGPPAQPGGGNVGTSAQLGHGCTNCFAAPLGTGANFSPGASGIGPTSPSGASTLEWASFNTAANSGTNGLRNQFDPYQIAWYEAAQERNGGHITVDQRLTRNISFYGSGFYSNRRAQFLNSAGLAPAANNALFNIAVPTFNPYYPSGAPANLRVNYNMGIESPGVTTAYELAQRYQAGLNIALPAGWSGRVWYAVTNDQNFNNTRGAINKAALSAALGWTINATRAIGSTPAIGTWTKPANVPYLNLFCDPLAYACNADASIAYIQGIRTQHQRYWINEKGVLADGPLFDLPGGTVKAAAGATYTGFRLQTTLLDTTNGSSLVVPYQLDAQARQVWAVFTQLNVPLFSDRNAIPFARRVELEVSWRHDQYSDVKGTSNPKVAFEWAPTDDVIIRSSWGTSFRTPVFGEISPLSNVVISGQNLNQFSAQPSEITAGCLIAANLPPVGSGAWKVESSWGNGTPGSATSCVSSLVRPPGIAVVGSSGGAAPIRAGGFHGWNGLKPEAATNWSIGFDYTPTATLLAGLNVQATYYVMKIDGFLRSFPVSNSSFNDPNMGFAFLVPTDWSSSGLPGAAGCTNNLLPTTCAPFQAAVTGLLANPRNTLDPQAKTLILWINDGGTFNTGWLKNDGIDFQASYDWEWSEFGSWNVGITGTRSLHSRVLSLPGGSATDDMFHTTLNPGLVNEARGVPTLPNFRYRARLGWTNGPWSVTAFMDYQSHFYHQQQPPPNVNGNFCASNGTLDAYGGGGTFPCALDDYTNLIPSYYAFDLSVGYNTMEQPGNEYLRNIGLQFVIQNVLDHDGSYNYTIRSGGVSNPCACDPRRNLLGRTISVIVTKQW